MRIVIFFIAALIYSHSTFAFRDSVGLKNINGKMFILHKVEKGEGLYSIGRKYNVKPAEIKSANPGKDNDIKIDQVLMVPYIASSKNASKTKIIPGRASKDESKNEAVHHTVASGETLYSIAKMYGIQVADLRKWNQQGGNELAIGQKIIVGYGEVKKVLPNGAETSWQKPREEAERAQREDSENIKSGKTIWKEVKESGVAAWVDDESIHTETKLALHKYAPVGTVIKLVNPMNGHSTLVKVVGKLPKNEMEENVLLKITKSTAEKLGLRDNYFRLDLSYGMEVENKK